MKVPNTTFDNLSSGTIEAWINLDTNDWETITSKYGSFISAQFGVGAYTTSGKLSLHTNGQTAVSTGTVATGGWHHVAVAFDSSGATFYIDGQSAGTTSGNFSVPVDTNPSAQSSLGAQISGGGTLVDVPLNGKMAEVRIWNDVRTAGEISANYNVQLTGSEANLQAYYRLNSNSQTVEDLAGNNDGTLGADASASVNDPTYDSGTTMSASVTIPEINWGPSVAFTIEGWIKTSVADGFVHDIVTKSDPGVWELGSKELVISGTGKVVFGANGGTELFGTSTVTDGEWHHVAFTYSGGVGKIYVDGILETSGAITLPADDLDHEVFIGSNNGTGQFFNGQIDDVRIWSTARDAGQIHDGMAEHYDYDQSGLVANYTFDNVNGTTVRDDAGTAQNGTLSGATISDSGNGSPEIVTPPARALDFDGNADVVTFGATIAPTGSAARTFMMWAKTDSDGAMTLFSYGNESGSGSSFRFGFNNWEGAAGGKGISLDVTGGAITFQPETDIDDGQWHHYAVVTPSGGSLRDVKIYQDGVLLTGMIALFGGLDTNLNTANAGNFKLGDYSEIGGSHYYFDGAMADMSVWSAELTTAQIRDYMANGPAGTESNLTALWHLDEGTGTTVNDVAGTATNGTVSGATWVDGAPDVDGNFLQIVENGSANGRMTAEDISGTPAYSLFDSPDHGTMQLNSVTGEWTYVPNSGYQGTDSFTLRATGGTSGIDDEVVSIKIGEDPTVNPADSVLSLDGSTGHVDVGTLDNLTGAMTIEAWIKWDGPQSVADNSGTGGINHAWARIVDFGTGQDGDNILLAANGGSGELSFDIRQGANNQSIKTVVDMPVDQWIHVAATTNGTTGSLYINGVLQTLQGGGTSGAIWSALNVSRGSSFIGESNWAAESTSDYQITDVRVWNVQRTATEIAENYDRRLEGDETGLYSYWKLDEGSGHVAVDASGNGHDGAVVGGATYASQSQISITGGAAYKGLVLGSDADHDTLSYSVDVANGNGPDHGTFTFNTDSNTYTYDPTDGYSGDDSVTVDVKDDHNQTTQHTIQFHLT